MSTKQKELRFRVSDQELAQIKENAKQLRMQINPFVRRIGTECIIIIEDRSLFYQHRDRICDIKHFLHFIERGFVTINVYRPKEMDDVYTIKDELIYLLNWLHKRMIQHHTKIYRKALKEVHRQISKIDSGTIPRPDKHADKRPNSIRIKVSDKKYEQIKDLADRHKLPVGVYLRYMALHPQFLHIDYPVFEKYTREAEKHMMKIYEIVGEMCFNNLRTPYAVTRIEKAVIDIVKNEHKLINEMALRRPHIAPLKEKYKQIMSFFEIDWILYEDARLNGELYDTDPVVDEIESDDWLNDIDLTLETGPQYQPSQKWLKSLEEEIARLNDIEEERIQGAYSVGIDNVLANAFRRSKGCF